VQGFCHDFRINSLQRERQACSGQLRISSYTTAMFLNAFEHPTTQYEGLSPLSLLPDNSIVPQAHALLLAPNAIPQRGGIDALICRNFDSAPELQTVDEKENNVKTCD